MPKTLISNDGATTMTPGPCPTCHQVDQWGLDAWGRVWCYCEMCVECLQLGSHEANCPYVDVDEED